MHYESVVGSLTACQQRRIARPPFGDEIDDFIWTTTGMIHADNEKKGNN
jgi:hypothetical protein